MVDKTNLKHKKVIISFISFAYKKFICTLCIEYFRNRTECTFLR